MDGNLYDLSCVPGNGSVIDVIVSESEEGTKILRHSTSHIMAQAVTELFPGTKVAIGPAIDKGFYYDFEREESFTPEDLKKIEKRMKRIVSSNSSFSRKVISREDAIRLFSAKGEKYKVELLEALEDEEVTMYEQGTFADLCRGPHIPNTSKVRHFKLLNTAGAYWRGDEKNPMLQRIYGTVFPTKEGLEGYITFLEEAKQRDHRKVGKDLEL